MNIDGKAYRTIWLDEADRLHVIDQHVLPHRFETATITSFSALCDAIRNMLVRGAGLIGATAGYGMWLAACEAPAKDTEDFDTFMSDAATALKRTRPTASNLAWAVDRQLGDLATNEMHGSGGVLVVLKPRPDDPNANAAPSPREPQANPSKNRLSLQGNKPVIAPTVYS